MERERLIEALKNKTLYPHPVQEITVIETHISWVLLTGDYAYKIKKPISLGFVDFSTLEKRHFFCEAEYRLNQALAHELYIGVIPIFGSLENPTFHAQNEKDLPIEYALQMHQFDEFSLLSNFISNNKLTTDIIYQIASQVADLHLTTETIYTRSNKIELTATENLQQAVIDNFSDCQKRITELNDIEKLDAIEAWSIDFFKKNLALFIKREEEGFIKACHGDLHLGNIVYQNKKIIIFDCIEFNDAFSNIDVMNEIAFLTMDLKVREQVQEAYQFLNDYLEMTGFFKGLPLLLFYEVYHAMVRTKVALLLKDQTHEPENYKQYLNFAFFNIPLISSNKNHLVILHGLPGSGKSSISKRLASFIQAILLRSDIERKRLLKDIPKTEWYKEDNLNAVYSRLHQLTEMLLMAGFSVVVDATFLKYEYRQMFQQLANQCNASFSILHCEADIQTLSSRIQKRNSETSTEASDANIEVLNFLRKNIDPLNVKELQKTFTISNQKNSSEEKDFLELIKHYIFR